MKNIRFLAVLCILLSLFIGVKNPVLGMAFATISGALLMPKTAGAFYAVGPLTLLDIATRSGQRVGAVVEEVLTVAPEWSIIPAISREGTTYDVLRRTALPAGNFRDANAGVALSKSEFVRDPKQMYFFDAQMDIDEAVVQAQTAGSGATFGDVLADEAVATVQGSVVNFGKQFYYGLKANAKGFEGIATQVAAGGDINAGGGTGSDTTSAYLVYLDPSRTNPQGVHFSVGNRGTFNFGTWMRQQVTLADTTKAMHYVNGMSFYCGLAIASLQSIWRIKAIKDGFPITDALGAQLLASVPLARRQNLRWLMNPNAGWLLQKSRTTDLVKNVPLPTECQGIPITYTDSILNTEKTGNLA